MHKLMATLLLLSGMAQAGELPDAPVPQHSPGPDRAFWVATVAHAAVRVGDDINTCRGLARGGAHEDVYPTQSCGGVVAWNAATFAAFTFAGYELAKHGHKRLATALQYVGAGTDAVGIATSRWR
jgi:hypothetical protein